MPIFALLILGILLFSKFYFPIETEDVWWHLSVGKWMSVTHSVPWEDMFSDMPRPHWILTQWLGTKIIYGIYSLGGEPGLIWARTIFFILIVGLFLFWARKRIPLFMLLGLAVVFAFGLERKCFLRPLIFNFLFIQFFMMILLDFEQGINRKRIWLLPILSGLWFNLHMGSFVYGSAFMVALVLSSLTSILEKYHFKLSLSESVKPLKSELITVTTVWILCYLSYLISPYGLEGFLYPFQAILTPNFIHRDVYFNVIQEMRSPGYLFEIKGLWVWLLIIISGLGINFSKTKIRFSFYLWLITIFLFIYGERSVDFFVVVMVYLSVASWQQASIRTLWERFPARKLWEPVAWIVGVLFCVWHAVYNFNFFIDMHEQKMLLISQTKDADNPHRVVQKLQRAKISGHVFASDLYSNYLLWDGFPQLKPFIDGRQANQPRFMEYLAISMNPEKYWSQAEQKYGFTIILLDGNRSFNYRILDYVAKQPDWQLCDIDGGSVLFLKRGVFSLPLEFLDFESNVKNAVPATPLEDIQGLFNHSPRYDKRWNFWAPEPYFVKDLEEGGILFAFGYRLAGYNKILHAYQTQHYDKAEKFLRIMVKDILEHPDKK